MRGVCLLIGEDPLLLQTRRWVLELRFQVEAFDNLAEVSEALSHRRFELAVLCSSLSANRCNEASSVIRGHAPGVKIIRLSALGEYGRTLCIDENDKNDKNDENNEDILSADGPRELLRRACELVEFSSGKKHRGQAPRAENGHSSE